MLWPKASPLDLDFGLCARTKLFNDKPQQQFLALVLLGNRCLEEHKLLSSQESQLRFSVLSLCKSFILADFLCLTITLIRREGQTLGQDLHLKCGFEMVALDD